jgi:glutamine phosphoribosylpyrophosphate amidotransferase
VDSATGKTSSPVCLLYIPSDCSPIRNYPGETVIITRNSVSRRQGVPPATFAPDIFEYVYFARPDSVLDGVSVYRSRMAMGDALAIKVKAILEEKNMSVDVVIPVSRIFGALIPMYSIKPIE